MIEKIDGIPSTKQEWAKRFLQEDPRLLKCCRHIIQSKGIIKEQTSVLSRFESINGKPADPSIISRIRNPDHVKYIVIDDAFDARQYIYRGDVVRNGEPLQERLIFITMDDLVSVVQSLDYLPIVEFDYFS